MDDRIVLQDVTHILKEGLSDSLVGIYLHGSMAMGGFHPNQSDIDILVVCRTNNLLIYIEELHRSSYILKTRCT